MPDDTPTPGVTMRTDILQEMLASGQLTSVKLVEHCLAQIDRYDGGDGSSPGIHAITNLNANVLEEAEALDQERSAGNVRSSLHGIPILVKDIFNVRDMSTTVGLECLSSLTPSEDATVVSKLRRAGALILAKTDPTGAVARNPFDTSRSPGFSSGGNSAGLAAGYAPIALGECSMGSSRIPASATSTVGFRPTMGVVSMHGAYRMSWTFDTAGPMATSVRDIATLMDVTAGYDPCDPMSIDTPTPSTYAEHLDPRFLKGKKIGIFEPFVRTADAGVGMICRAVAQDMQSTGADVVSIGSDWGTSAAVPAEFSFFSTFLEWCQCGMWTLGETKSAATEWLSTLKSADASSSLLSTLVPELPAAIEYTRALTDLDIFRAWFHSLMDACSLDALIYPTSRTLPGKAGASYDFSNTTLACLLSCPALSVPAGFADGLPVGVDIMGRKYCDTAVLGMGYAYEQATRRWTNARRRGVLDASADARVAGWAG